MVYIYSCSNSMKLHINQEQLNELSEKGKQGLIEWWADKNFQGIYGDKTHREKTRTLPLLSIGQMIEFLMDNTAGVNMESFSELTGRDDNDPWYVITNNNNNFTNEYKELADALWAAVKEILNE